MKTKHMSNDELRKFVINAPIDQLILIVKDRDQVLKERNSLFQLIKNITK